MINRRKLLHILAVALLLVSGVSTSLFAGAYYSPKGKFRVTFPDMWHQVDYFTVDAIFKAKEAGESVLDYDAVIADSTIIPFYKSAYVIVTVDQAPPFDDNDIDSVLTQMKRVFGTDVRYFPVGDFMATQATNAPVYDTSQRVVSVLSDVVEGGESIKKHLFMMKFYEGGIANFFCYAPDSLFAEAVPLFQQMVSSLTYGEAETLAPKSQVKIADIENRSIVTSPTSATESSSLPLPWIIAGAVVVIGAIILFTRRKSG